MIRRALRPTLARLAATAPGRRALSAVVREDPELASELLAPALNRSRLFATASLPERLDGFEDLAFLFTSGVLDHGIVSMALDEAAYLYRLVRTLHAATIVEIGRFKGGSTFLLASAMDERSELTSYDLRVKLPDAYDYDELDRSLVGALARYGLAERVQLVVADSRRATPPERPCDLVFFDGDHSYDGVRADLEHWRPHLATGGHAVFHDAARSPLHSFEPDVARLIAEIVDDGSFGLVGGAGSLVHLRAAA